jgi:AcrR family transcriptional regulator
MRPMAIRQTDLTREKLLGAAFNEIHLHGFQAASIANILRDTGLTKGALYHHFPNKQKLGLAVIDEVVKGYLDDTIFSRIRQSEHPVSTLIEIIAASGVNCSLESISLGCPLNNLMQEISPLDDEFKACLNGILSTWREVIEEALQRERAAGRLRQDVDCRAAALFILSAWEGCVGIAKSLQSPEGFNSCMKQLEDYVSSLLVR